MLFDFARPILASYWVEPKQFLAGEYPTICEETHRIDRILAFLHAGFNTFIDLTKEDELPSYQQLLYKLAKEKGFEVQYHRFAIEDRCVPGVEQMTEILDALDFAIVKRHLVYLHCRAGIGRTGTVVGCYFVRRGLTGERALRRLNEIYRTSAQSNYFPSTPENEQQKEYILHWGGIS